MLEKLAFVPPFAAHCINTIVSIILVILPYRKTRKISRWKLYTVGAVGCLYGLVFFFEAWQTGNPDLYFTPLTYCVKMSVVVLGFFIMRYLVQGNFWQYGFIASIMGQYVAGASAVSADLVYCITGSPATFALSWLHLGSLVALYAVTLPLIWLFFKQLIPLVEIDKHVLHWHWLCAIPLLFNIIFNMKFYRGGFLTYGRGSWADLWLAILWFCATFGAYAIVLFSLNRAVQSMRFKEDLRLLQLQSDMHREQNARLCEYAEDVRRTEHDLRHHFVALKSLAAEGDCEGVQSYLEACLPHIQTRRVLACANPALEAVLNYYLSRATALGAAVQGTVALPAVLGPAESDVCMVFGNLTENALEALQKQTQGERFLHVDAKLTRDNLLTLSVSNSCSAPPTYRDGVLWSAKRDGAGVGTASVTAVATKRQGFARYKETGGTFTAFVCMNLAPIS